MNRKMVHAANIFAFGKTQKGVWKSNDLAAWTGDKRRLYESMLQRLAVEGYLEAKRGPRGGYQLTNFGYEVTLATLVKLYGSKTDKALLPLLMDRYANISPMEAIDAVKRYEKDLIRMGKVAA